ncbi:MAG: RidA family protein [Bacteroidia bacterium]|nr:RidA family protein [Bacteroidia bacterium]
MKPLHTDDAPKALGPYSQAQEVSGFLFLSGQVGIDPKTGTLASGFEAQARQVLANLRAVLAVRGLGLNAVAKTTVFLQNFDDFATLNALYAEAFGDHKPARSTVEVSRLPAGALVEIECIAHLG